MAQYVLLLWENPSAFVDASPAEMQAVIQEYVAWRQRMGAAGKVTGGFKLTDDGGKRLRGGTVQDGPYAEAHEVIGGLFQIEATDYADAVAVASSCPHLRNGWIELREVEPT